MDDIEVSVNSVGTSLKWLVVGIGENSDSVVGVCVGVGFVGRW